MQVYIYIEHQAHARDRRRLTRIRRIKGGGDGEKKGEERIGFSMMIMMMMIMMMVTDV